MYFCDKYSKADLKIVNNISRYSDSKKKIIGIYIYRMAFTGRQHGTARIDPLELENELESASRCRCIWKQRNTQHSGSSQAKANTPFPLRNFIPSILAFARRLRERERERTHKRTAASSTTQPSAFASDSIGPSLSLSLSRLLSCRSRKALARDNGLSSGEVPPPPISSLARTSIYSYIVRSCVNNLVQRPRKQSACASRESCPSQDDDGCSRLSSCFMAKVRRGERERERALRVTCTRVKGLLRPGHWRSISRRAAAAGDQLRNCSGDPLCGRIYGKD